ETACHGRLKVHSGGPLRSRPLAQVAQSPRRWPAPAATARHGRSKSTLVARSDGDRSPRSLKVHSGGPLRRRPLATVASKYTPVARSGGDRSPRSLKVHSDGPLRRKPLATVAWSQVQGSGARSLGGSRSVQ